MPQGHDETGFEETGDFVGPNPLDDTRGGEPLEREASPDASRYPEQAAPTARIHKYLPNRNLKAFDRVEQKTCDRAEAHSLI